MKYNKIVCCVNPQEIYALKSKNTEHFPAIFTESLDDFRQQINKNSFLVLSMTNVENNLSEVKSFLRNFPQNNFHFINRLDGEGLSIKQFEILDEENVVSVPYDIEEIFLEATGKIDNIFQKRGILSRRH